MATGASTGPEPDSEQWSSWSDSVVLAWDERGLPVTLAGPAADPLDEPVHVITAFDPMGRPTSSADNAFAQHELFAELDREQRRWRPGVGAVPDGGHHEISAVVWGWGRAQAREAGARHQQRAVYEIDGDELRVVACDDESVTSRPRSHPPGARHDIGAALVAAWRDECETILGRGVGRVHCPACGAADPARGRVCPAGAWAPEWIDAVSDHNGAALALRCLSCGRRW